MKECNECGKTLKIFEGYRHPTMGKEHPVCGHCFDMINESVMKWQEYVIEHPQPTYDVPAVAFKLSIPKAIMASIMVLK